MVCHLVLSLSFENEKALSHERAVASWKKVYKLLIDGNRTNKLSCGKYLYIYV